MECNEENVDKILNPVEHNYDIEMTNEKFGTLNKHKYYNL